MTNADDASVVTMPANVRVLQFGNRQLDLALFKQLDEVMPWRLTPFGRVRSDIKYRDTYVTNREADIEVIGRGDNGDLVKAVVISTRYIPGHNSPSSSVSDEERQRYADVKATWDELCESLRYLPLIAMARR